MAPTGSPDNGLNTPPAAGGTVFCETGIGLLRAPVHALGAPGGVHGPAAVSGSGPDEAARLSAWLCTMVADPLVEEAVAVSSPALAAVVGRVREGGPVGLRQLRRAVRSLARYRLRMSTRATPFGLMAGVAAVRFTGEAAVRLGGAHTRAVRPDQEWLTHLVACLERRPEVLRHVRLVSNGLCFRRGGRLVLPYVPQTRRDDEPAESGVRAVHEVSVRLTSVVETVLEATERPVTGAEAVRLLLEGHPGATEDQALGALSQLVGTEMLLTDVRPPLESADPLGHVIHALSGIPSGALPGGVPELPGLLKVQQGIAQYAAQPLGTGAPALASVTGVMRGLAACDHLLQVDLALDARVHLPHAVAEEAARAAGLLWRLAPADGRPPHLREYHEAFLERYGTDRLVPLTELLDAGTGLSAPAGYRRPPSTRTAPAPAVDHERDQVLGALTQEAVLAGQPEIILDDDHPAVRRLADDRGRPPDSLEVLAHLLAASETGLAAGDFRLVLLGGSQQEGAVLGRFTYLLDRRTRQQVIRTARGEGDDGVLAAQLTFRPERSRTANVGQAPAFLDHLLPVGTYADPGQAGVLDVRRLAVGADFECLHLVDTASGRHVEPAVFHALNPEWGLPNAARFLAEVSSMHVRPWQAWQWGAAAHLPHLPRVRYGRTILAPARWRPPPELRDPALTTPQWTRALHSWRERWRVPSRLWAGQRDVGLLLDLDLPGHADLLRRELLDAQNPELRETPADAAGIPNGWLHGPGGAHHSEIVIPLRNTAPRPAPRHVPRRPLPRTTPGDHLPGGPWLFASLYASAARHDELLAVHLTPFLTSLPGEVDRWFFVRYHDSSGSHLRLRFHAPQPVLANALLPQLHRTAADLREAGLISRMAVDSYDPELERYGGPDAIAAAEKVFHTDSITVLEHLKRRHRHQDTSEPAVLTAAGFTELARAFHTDAPEAADWLLRTFRKDEEHHRAFRGHRATALDLIDPYRTGPAPAAAADPALQTAWNQRAEAVAQYARQLRDLGSRSWTDPTRVLSSLLHMHHNRLIGTDPDTERAAYAIARGATQAHTDRRRHTNQHRPAALVPAEPPQSG
ncbi:lantibiotic dehydratase [Streptomyces hyaluromycini]|uniref:lantibiotic dehydratase n=1 Tax=Streptomyces hyaluromycini TaxID=1377993 RepID=UPI0011AE1E6E|nr:lantibiotic dehydratase [Streptomyces hyaluromycini]